MPKRKRTSVNVHVIPAWADLQTKPDRYSAKEYADKQKEEEKPSDEEEEEKPSDEEEKEKKPKGFLQTFVGGAKYAAWKILHTLIPNDLQQLTNDLDEYGWALGSLMFVVQLISQNLWKVIAVYAFIRGAGKVGTWKNQLFFEGLRYLKGRAYEKFYGEGGLFDKLVIENFVEVLYNSKVLGSGESKMLLTEVIRETKEAFYGELMEELNTMVNPFGANSIEEIFPNGVEDEGEIYRAITSLDRDVIANAGLTDVSEAIYRGDLPDVMRQSLRALYNQAILDKNIFINQMIKPSRVKPERFFELLKEKITLKIDSYYQEQFKMMVEHAKSLHEAYFDVFEHPPDLMQVLIENKQGTMDTSLHQEAAEKFAMYEEWILGKKPFPEMHSEEFFGELGWLTDYIHDKQIEDAINLQKANMRQLPSESQKDLTSGMRELFKHQRELSKGITETKKQMENQMKYMSHYRELEKVFSAENEHCIPNLEDINKAFRIIAQMQHLTEHEKMAYDTYFANMGQLLHQEIMAEQLVENRMFFTRYPEGDDDGKSWLEHVGELAYSAMHEEAGNEVAVEEDSIVASCLNEFEEMMQNLGQYLQETFSNTMAAEAAALDHAEYHQVGAEIEMDMIHDYSIHDMSSSKVAANALQDEAARFKGKFKEIVSTSLTRINEFNSNPELVEIKNELNAASSSLSSMSASRPDISDAFSKHVELTRGRGKKVRMVAKGPEKPPRTMAKGPEKPPRTKYKKAFRGKGVFGEEPPPPPTFNGEGGSSGILVMEGSDPEVFFNEKLFQNPNPHQTPSSSEKKVQTSPAKSKNDDDESNSKGKEEEKEEGTKECRGPECSPKANSEHPEIKTKEDLKRWMRENPEKTLYIFGEGDRPKFRPGKDNPADFELMDALRQHVDWLKDTYVEKPELFVAPGTSAAHSGETHDSGTLNSGLSSEEGGGIGVGLQDHGGTTLAAEAEGGFFKNVVIEGAGLLRLIALGFLGLGAAANPVTGIAALAEEFGEFAWAIYWGQAILNMDIPVLVFGPMINLVTSLCSESVAAVVIPFLEGLAAVGEVILLLAGLLVLGYTAYEFGLALAHGGAKLYDWLQKEYHEIILGEGPIENSYTNDKLLQAAFDKWAAEDPFGGSPWVYQGASWGPYAAFWGNHPHGYIYYPNGPPPKVLTAWDYANPKVKTKTKTFKTPKPPDVPTGMGGDHGSGGWGWRGGATTVNMRY